jgi:hypothetical protein
VRSLNTQRDFWCVDDVPRARSRWRASALSAPRVCPRDGNLCNGVAPSLARRHTAKAPTARRPPTRRSNIENISFTSLAAEGPRRTRGIMGAGNGRAPRGITSDAMPFSLRYWQRSPQWPGGDARRESNDPVKPFGAAIRIARSRHAHARAESGNRSHC